MSREPFSPMGPHHGYLGLLMMGYSITFWASYPVSGSIVGLAGLVIFLDDLVEHTLNKNTPLRKLWLLIYKYVK